MKKTYDLIIPIGSKCKCSFNLRRLHLQYESFPFDWIYIKNPDVVEKLLQTDFKDFLLEKNLRLRSKQPRFDEVDIWRPAYIPRMILIPDALFMNVILP